MALEFSGGKSDGLSSDLATGLGFCVRNALARKLLYRWVGNRSFDFCALIFGKSIRRHCSLLSNCSSSSSSSSLLSSGESA